MDAEDLLFLMYTSGTTAKPKGIVHTTGGYLVGAATTHYYVFDLKPDTDVYWCAADVGWITGHSYIVYGPLCNGATSVMYEGTPDFPDKDRWWSIIERYGVTILYTAPTAIRSHMKWGPEHAAKHDLSSLRLLGSVGEPINPEAWVWYHEHIGGERCPIVDTWWQTETGMILITPLPGVTTTKPGSATRPFPGVDAAVYNEAGDEVGPGGGGYLVLKRPWPSMLRGIYGDDARYRETYWSKYDGVYFAGDGARVDEDGDFWLLGRVDDVMNVSGHRISTIEVESALVDHPEVAEAAVAARNDATTGQAIVAFVTLKGGADGSVEKLEELRNHVAQKIGPIAKPANIVFTPELPKTRSGKIMRRLLRDVAENRPLGDTTTLADPTVVEEIRSRGQDGGGQGGLDRSRGPRRSARPRGAGAGRDRARAGRERLGGAERGASAARSARLAVADGHADAAARARRAHADAGAVRRARPRSRASGRLDEDRGPGSAVAARRARLSRLGAVVAARPGVRGAARRHREGGAAAERDADRLRLAGPGRRAARVRDAKAPGDARRDRAHGGAVRRPPLPLGRAVTLGLRLLRADVGRISRARHHDPARRRRAVRRRPAGHARADAARATSCSTSTRSSGTSRCTSAAGR